MQQSLYIIKKTVIMANFKIKNRPRNSDLPNSNGKRSLNFDEFLTSPTSAFVLVFQRDSNLVLYGIDDKPFAQVQNTDDSKYCISSTQEYVGSSPIFATNTNGTGADNVQMQTDGNLVLYRGTPEPVNAVFASQTAGNPDSFLRVQDDGNVVIYNRDGIPIFASNTSIHR
jgi:hypothetical protein